MLFIAAGFVAASAMGTEPPSHASNARATMQLVGLKERVKPNYPQTRTYQLSPEIYAQLGLPAEPTTADLRQALEKAGLTKKQQGTMILLNTRKLVFRGFPEDLDQVEAILLLLGKGYKISRPVE